jgi:2-dehydro-3-deoxyphosphogluconate aldolase/(4S)-4-hydroxy-2-oxoglutarate aldolase
VSAAAAHAQAIVEARLIAIVRSDGPDAAVSAIGALADAGVHVSEISLATPGALAALERSAAMFGEEMLIGAGTVRSLRDAEQAICAGARFLVSPGLDRDVLSWACERDVLHLPGAFTPTEVGRALAGGAHLVKLFPAARLGPEYVRDLLAPFPEARLVPTGGITPSNASSFLDAGAVAVAVGGALVNPTTLADPAQLSRTVRQFNSLIRS